MKRKRAALLATGVLILVGGAATVTYVETRQHERDRHALLRHASEMERAIRAPGTRMPRRRPSMSRCSLTSGAWADSRTSR